MDTIETRAAKAFVRARDTGRFCFERRLLASKINPGKLSLLGGKLEEGEEPEEALRRELREEATIHKGNLRKLTEEDVEILAKEGKPARIAKNIYYIVTVDSEADTVATDEVAGLEWLDLDQVADADPVDFVRKLIKEHREEILR